MSGRGANLALAAGLGAFACAGLAFPFVLRSRQEKPIIDAEKPLNSQAVQRGPYMNSGSKDRVSSIHETAILKLGTCIPSLSSGKRPLLEGA
eukprot:SM000127S26637  [mRNA]  locus=s127:94482:95763:- [translate_table: standard]